MEIVEIKSDAERERIARRVLEALTEWFGISGAREEYIKDSFGQPFFCACDGGEPVGFLYLKQTGKDTVELAAMGVLKERHRRGIGRALLERAKGAAREGGYSFLQVKTVQMGRYDSYDATNRFYRANGFKEFEVFPALWDERNPCQVYVMAL